MKKNLHLALQTSGFIALFALALTSGVRAEEAAATTPTAEATVAATTNEAPATNAVAPEAATAPTPAPEAPAAPVTDVAVAATPVAPVQDATANSVVTPEAVVATTTEVVAQPVAVASTEVQIDKEALFQHAPRRKHKVSAKKQARRLAHLNKKLDRWEAKEDSLSTTFNTLVTANPQNATPLEIDKIAAINNDDELRLEIYKLMEAASHSTNEASKADREKVKNLMLALAHDVKVSKSQTEEILLNMLTKKNFAYLSENDIKDVFAAMNRGDLDTHDGHHASGRHGHNDKKETKNKKKKQAKKANKKNKNAKKKNAKKANKKKVNKKKKAKKQQKNQANNEQANVAVENEATQVTE